MAQTDSIRLWLVFGEKQNIYQLSEFSFQIFKIGNYEKTSTIVTRIQLKFLYILIRDFVPLIIIKKDIMRRHHKVIWCIQMNLSLYISLQDFVSFINIYKCQAQ